MCVFVCVFVCLCVVSNHADLVHQRESLSAVTRHLGRQKLEFRRPPGNPPVFGCKPKTDAAPARKTGSFNDSQTERRPPSPYPRSLYEDL